MIWAGLGVVRGCRVARITDPMVFMAISSIDGVSLGHGYHGEGIGYLGPGLQGQRVYVGELNPHSSPDLWHRQLQVKTSSGRGSSIE
jgi:hypothetical protein